jgi:hypothetical protein
MTVTCCRITTNLGLPCGSVLPVSLDRPFSGAYRRCSAVGDGPRARVELRLSSTSPRPPPSPLNRSDMSRTTVGAVPQKRGRFSAIFAEVPAARVVWPMSWSLFCQAQDAVTYFRSDLDTDFCSHSAPHLVFRLHLISEECFLRIAGGPHWCLRGHFEEITPLRQAVELDGRAYAQQGVYVQELR